MKNKMMRSLVFAFSSVALLGITLSVGSNATFGTRYDALSMTVGYKSDYSSKQEALEAGLDLNEQICKEGMVLLKNEDKTLPLVTHPGTNATRITVFGYASVSPLGGASESGDTSAGTVKLTSDLYSSLKDAGYETNPVVREAYTNWKNAVDENGTAKYTSDYALASEFEASKANLEKSFNQYSDAAIIMLSKGAGDELTHPLQFDAKQMELVDYVTSKFDKVIVLINNSKPMEMKALQDNEKIDAILLVGQPGDNGFNAVGKLLNGEANPSGKLADLYAADFTKTPSYNNYSISGPKIETPDLTGGTGNYLTYKVDGKDTNSYFVDYEEGIYVGYRYFETRAVTESDGETWYKNNVVYPFGYGLSYTTFDWDVKPVLNTGSTITKDQTLKFNVTVTNTGDVAGKDVVEMYYTAPYTPGSGIEKAHVLLGDFEKTSVLQPGQSETVQLELDVSDMASYDYKVEKTYVLDAGDYEIKFMSDSHTEKGTKVTYNVADKVLCNTSDTGYEVTNRFDDVNAGVEKWQDVLSRDNFAAGTTFPTEEERVLTAEEYKAWTAEVDADYDKDSPWEAKEMPKYADEATRPAKAEVVLSDLIGKDYNDPLWDDLLDQLTLKEMEDLINNGGFHSISIDYIGKPYAHDTDGPAGWTGNGTAGSRLNAFACETLIACTWSKDLAYQMGKIVADQGIWGCSDRTDGIDGGRVYGYTGWYAPAMNTHRSPFDGRYTEYYSEDGVLAGMLAANASLGAKSKGAYVFIKHFALHDDGAGVSGYYDADAGVYVISGYRGTAGDPASGLSVWCNEQAMREVYLKPFQIAVEEGHATACMSAFNRLGATWAGGSYALLTEVLRNEWGFEGMVVTDISIYGFLNADQMIRAGGDMVLNSTGSLKIYANDYTKGNPATQVAAMRRATKAVLFTVANSNAMQMPQGASVIYGEGNVNDTTVGEAYNASVATAELNTMSDYSEEGIKYAVTAGRLPDGLTLDEDGTITGTATKAGTYTFTITASAGGYASASKDFTIIVAEKVDDTTPNPGDDDGELDEIKTTLAGLQGVAIGGLVVSIIALVGIAGMAVLTFVKRRN